VKIDFASRYGPFALVAGASAGLGCAFAHELARRGLNLILVARREPALERVRDEVTATYNVDVRTIVLDLASPRSAEYLEQQTHDVAVGLLVYNAALSLIGPFLDHPLEAHVRELETNCRGPLTLAYAFSQGMVKRGRGGIVLMSSLAGFQGSPYISHYAATKAYNTVLAESLWAELAPHGVDVLACCAGATATRGYAQTASRGTSRFAPAALEPRDVVCAALDALGNGPSVVPGRANRFAQFLLQRVLPRRAAIRLMERSTRHLSQSSAS
jgi:uncharacterized protein